MSEQVYFDQNKVRITSTRAIFDSKTYTLATVTSVDVRRVDPDCTVPYIFVVAGVFTCAVSIFILLSSALFGVLFLLIGVLTIVVGIIWSSRIEPTYAVIICTAARERRVYASASEKEIGAIVAALNQAIVDRG